MFKNYFHNLTYANTFTILLGRYYLYHLFNTHNSITIIILCNINLLEIYYLNNLHYLIIANIYLDLMLIQILMITILMMKKKEQLKIIKRKNSTMLINIKRFEKKIKILVGGFKKVVKDLPTSIAKHADQTI